MKHLKLKIYGKVQGVFFRASAKERADDLGVKGFARNEPDDSVYIEAEGSESALEFYTAWCHRGPMRARVDRVEITEGTLVGYSDFTINR